MAWEQQANLQDGAQQLLLVWSNRHLPTDASFISLEMSLPPFFSSIDSCSLVSILICSTWFGFRNNFFMHAASNPWVPACHSAAAKKGQARTASCSCSGTSWTDAVGNTPQKDCKGVVMLRIMNISYFTGKT